MSRGVHIGYWCPALLGQTGVADYGFMLAEALARVVPVTHVVRRDWQPFTISGVTSLTDTEALVPGQSGPTVHLYHIGNSARHHAHMLAPLLRTGGIVVLHDLSLFDLFHQMYRWQPELWASELAAHGYHLDSPIDSETIKSYRLSMRFLDTVVRAADVVVVHTQWAAAHLQSLFPDTRIVYVPLAAKSVPYVSPPEVPTLSILGGLAPHKGLGVALAAVPRLVQKFPNLQVRVIGRNDDLGVLREAEQLVVDLGIASKVVIRTDVTDEEAFTDEFRRASLVVALRTESIGEMSGIMPRAWGAGRVVIASDQPQFQLFPHEVCARVPLGDDATEGVYQAVVDALLDPTELERRSILAWEFGQEQSFDVVATKLVEEASRVLASRTRYDVNVIGSWGSPTGLAQRSRHLVRELDERLSITTPYTYTVQQHHSTLVPECVVWGEARARAPINLWTANVNEMPIVSHALTASRTQPYNIGLWIYEFPHLPAHMLPTVRRVDEVWAGSSFAADTFKSAGVERVYVMPDIVELRTPSRSLADVRRELGIRPEQTMFFFSFDYRSGWGRKNPDGAVRAFRDANLGDDAVLVVKSSYLTPEFARVLREEAGQANVMFMDGYIDAALMSDLFCAADVYVSLHRCEGFGLGMAESMRLGKTVIGTAYSGNLDYMNSENALLVEWTPGHVRQVDIDANPGLETVVDLGSPWAEPSHEAAVTAIRIAMNVDHRAARGARAATDISRTHSPSVVGEQARQRLIALQHDLGIA